MQATNSRPKRARRIRAPPADIINEEQCTDTDVDDHAREDKEQRKLPESFDDMVECEECLTWYHYRCCGYTGKENNWKCDHCAPKSKRLKY